jgi:predicted  nucleic acid-binding Zn-ribbon protein
MPNQKEETVEELRQELEDVKKELARLKKELDDANNQKDVLSKRLTNLADLYNIVQDAFLNK